MDWLEELQDVGIRGTLQDSGYFKAKLKVDARLLDGNERRNRYALTLHIEEGWQYRLGNVRFKPADPDKTPLAFSASELRRIGAARNQNSPQHRIYKRWQRSLWRVLPALAVTA
jgi:hypothetical protein